MWVYRRLLLGSECLSRRTECHVLCPDQLLHTTQTTDNRRLPQGLIMFLLRPSTSSNLLDGIRELGTGGALSIYCGLFLCIYVC